MIILDLIAFILVIGIIILVHEAGHFFTAKKSGVKCNEFSIGMGPVIKQWKKDETTISLRWIPLGGYVSMVDGNESDLYIDLGKELRLNLENGCVKEIVLNDKISADVVGICRKKELKSIHGEPLEIDLEIDGEIKTYPVLENASYILSPSEKIKIEPYDRSFDSKKIWQRLIILVAGATMNFILGLLLCIIAAFIEGVPNYNSTIVGSLSESYPAYEAGLREGDSITAIIDKTNDKTYEISSWTDISNIISSLYDDAYPEVVFEYERDGEVGQTSSVRPYVYIYNVGITNAGAISYPNTSGVNGAVVGYISIDYDEDGGNELSSGDLITAIRVDVWNGEEYAQSEYQSVTGWQDLITLLDVDTAQVYFKYLARTESDSNVTYSEELTTNSITTFSEEVLDAQNVDKMKFLFGFSPEYHKDFAGCMSNAFKECGSYFSLVVKTLKVLIVPSNGARTIGLSNMSSVVGIFDMVSQYLTAGPSAFLFFIAMLSINIGLMNLLPIPALDGGRIIFVLYEGLTGRKPNKKFESGLTLIVYLLLIILFVYITINDIKRLVG